MPAFTWLAVALLIAATSIHEGAGQRLASQLTNAFDFDGEETVMAVAAEWSLNPPMLDERDDLPPRGLPGFLSERMSGDVRPGDDPAQAFVAGVVAAPEWLRNPRNGQGAAG